MLFDYDEYWCKTQTMSSNNGIHRYATRVNMVLAFVETVVDFVILNIVKRVLNANGKS